MIALQFSRHDAIIFKIFYSFELFVNLPESIFFKIFFFYKCRLKNVWLVKKLKYLIQGSLLV